MKLIGAPVNSCVFFLKINALLKKMITNLIFKVLPIVVHNFFPSFWQELNSALKIIGRFIGYPRIDPIFDFNVIAEVLVSQAMLH